MVTSQLLFLKAPILSLSSVVCVINVSPLGSVQSVACDACVSQAQWGATASPGSGGLDVAWRGDSWQRLLALLVSLFGECYNGKQGHYGLSGPSVPPSALGQR